jgi:hypothetical protein
MGFFESRRDKRLALSRCLGTVYLSRIRKKAELSMLRFRVEKPKLSLRSVKTVGIYGCGVEANNCKRLGEDIPSSLAMSTTL